MRTPDQHLVTLGVLASGARDEAVREAAAWAGEVARLSAEVRGAQGAYFASRSQTALRRSLDLERHLDQLLGRTTAEAPRQLGLGLGGGQ